MSPSVAVNNFVNTSSSHSQTTLAGRESLRRTATIVDVHTRAAARRFWAARRSRQQHRMQETEGLLVANDRGPTFLSTYGVPLGAAYVLAGIDNACREVQTWRHTHLLHATPARP